MASIKPSINHRGDACFYVHWQDPSTGHGRRKIFKSIDEAVLCFWSSEMSSQLWRTLDKREFRRSWTVQKLIYFFLGRQQNKLNQGVIRYSTYQKCRYDLMAIDGQILKKTLSELNQLQLSEELKTGAQRWMRSAFNLLVGMKVITTNPFEKRKRDRRKPITIPAKATVKRLLADAPIRERIACWLGGVCGLRIGEALALTYADLSDKWISVHKHIGEDGIEDGLKNDVQRRIKMPRGLFALLDHSLLGTDKPVICSQRNGQHLGIKYGNQGPLKRVLNEYGIKKFHHLRHFAVSRLADRGVDILKVSRMIGHSDIRTTMNIYGHLFGETIDLDFD